jgi:uncharacterized membrane protein
MIKKSLFFLVVILVAIQFIPLKKTNPKVDEAIALHTDEKVMKILRKSCYDCHSNETKWSVYADIAPLSFGVVSHVEDGRAALNFSEYKTIPQEIKIARLNRAISTVKLGIMPLSSYVLFHPEASLSKEEKKVLIAWFEKELQKTEQESTK